MKRIVSLLLIISLLLAWPLSAGAATARQFTDIQKKNWYAGAVYALTDRGIISGTSATTYSPGQPLTRGQFMQLLAAATLSDREMEYYKNQASDFPDVPAGKWYTAGANWGQARGLVYGISGRFEGGKAVTRAQTAAFLVRYATFIQGKEFEERPVEQNELFTDDASLPAWARQDVYLCRRAGLLSGYSDGSFQPNKQLTRAEAASLLCRLLDIPPLEKDALPDDPVPPTPAYVAPTSFTTTVWGLSVQAVTFDPAKGYDTRVALANDRLFSTESGASIVSRTGAAVAVNGTFFSSYDGTNVTFGTVMNNGVFSRIDNSRAPYKPAFAVDDQGHASIEFCKINQVLTATRNGEPVATVENVGCNVDLPAGDGSRMMYTRQYRAAVSGAVADAVEVSADGVVTKVYHQGASDVAIPAAGYLLAVRTKRWDGDPLFTDWQVGDRVTVSTKYEGASKQNFAAMLSCGPTVVKNGAVYGNDTTFAQEGFTDEKITSWSAPRMAIGIKADGTVVIASCSCTMAQLSQVMLGLGCVNAMNLDGGASCALYVNGSAVIPEGRQMNNMLVFRRK